MMNGLQRVFTNLDSLTFTILKKKTNWVNPANSVIWKITGYVARTGCGYVQKK
jgi:hypothetical protein